MTVPLPKTRLVIAWLAAPAIVNTAYAEPSFTAKLLTVTGAAVELKVIPDPFSTIVPVPDLIRLPSASDMLIKKVSLGSATASLAMEIRTFSFWPAVTAIAEPAV